ncbi:MAG: glycosyltransferase, partial [Candidatus Magnetoovum sp. WYHC-5]|nr:glycosyltransferase [Candidatus Magnetoovum sp. WYHC-5]
MKVVHINEHFPVFGGTEKNLLDICTYLKENGHEVIVISSRSRAYSTIINIKNYQIEPSYGIRSACRVFKEFKKILHSEKPDIIHIHNTQNFVSPIVLKYIVKHWPTVKTVHDTRLFCPAYCNWKVLKTSMLCPYPIGISCFIQKCYPFIADFDLIKDVCRGKT